MLDPSTYASADAHLGQVIPLVGDAHAAIELVKEAEARTRRLAAAIELLSALDAADSLEQAAHRSASLLCELLSAGRALVLWRHHRQRGLKVIADSDEPRDSNANTEYRLAAAAGEEVAARDVITEWPPADAVGRHALMAVRQFAQSLSADSLTGIRLNDASGRDRGVVLVINLSGAHATRTLDAIEMPLASKLIGIERLQPTRLEHAVRSFVDVARGPRRYLILCVAIAFGLAMLLPVRYRIAAELELQPVKRRFIAVPFDGPLQSAHVRPGDMVEQGDLLATINPREIEYELASLRAELNRAIQEQKGLMAEHDTAGSKIAALESDRLRVQSDLLQYRHDNLEIRSPISGVVVSGDLKESEGMPMSRGETLFEIAPLGQMVVEIAVPENDVTHVREGMQADFHVHALPSRTMHGTIVRIHPRAELKNHDNVYIAEVHITDAENLLRPGMRGRAKIMGDRHPLGWNLFHKAYFALLRVVGW